MLLGGPEDQAAVEPVRASVPRDRCIDLVGREELIVAYAALKRARLFVGNDSGLMHLAAAAGAPTLGLFGPSDEALYAPWGARARTVRGVRSFQEMNVGNPNFSHVICHMMDLQSSSVLAAARSLLADTAPSGPAGAPAGEGAAPQVEECTGG